MVIRCPAHLNFTHTFKWNLMCRESQGYVSANFYSSLKKLIYLIFINQVQDMSLIFYTLKKTYIERSTHITAVLEDYCSC